MLTKTVLCVDITHISRFYSILVTSLGSCLVTSHESECNPPLKCTRIMSKEANMKIYKVKPSKLERSMFDNNTFKKVVLTTMMITTLIINLGYLDSRESSKTD